MVPPRALSSLAQVSLELWDQQAESTSGQRLSENLISSWCELWPLDFLFWLESSSYPICPKAMDPPPGSRHISAWEGPRKLEQDYQSSLRRRPCAKIISGTSDFMKSVPFANSVGQKSPPSPPGSPGTGLRGATQTGEHHENCYYPALLERKSFRESWRPFLFRIWKVQKMNGKLK